MDVFATPWDWPQIAKTFNAANAARSEQAAARAVPAARKALRVPGLTQDVRRALRLRVQHPNLTLTELADQAGLTKDQYAGRLRRGLRAAEDG